MYIIYTHNEPPVKGAASIRVMSVVEKTVDGVLEAPEGSASHSLTSPASQPSLANKSLVMLRQFGKGLFGCF